MKDTHPPNFDGCTRSPEEGQDGSDRRPLARLRGHEHVDADGRKLRLGEAPVVALSPQGRFSSTTVRSLTEHLAKKLPARLTMAS